MSRWVVFDQETFNRVRRQLPRENLFEHGARNAVEYATHREETVVAVLALDSKKQAGVAVFRPVQGNRSATVAAAAGPKLVKPTQAVREGVEAEARRAQEAQVRAGGLLGLRDESFFEEQPKPQRKQSWWRRFWPEED